MSKTKTPERLSTPDSALDSFLCNWISYPNKVEDDDNDYAPGTTKSPRRGPDKAAPPAHNFPHGLQHVHRILSAERAKYSESKWVSTRFMGSVGSSFSGDLRMTEMFETDGTKKEGSSTSKLRLVSHPTDEGYYKVEGLVKMKLTQEEANEKLERLNQYLSLREEFGKFENLST